MTPLLEVSIAVCLILGTVAAVGWLAFVARLRWREQARRERAGDERARLLGGFVNERDREISDLMDAGNEAAMKAKARVLRQQERL